MNKFRGRHMALVMGIAAVAVAGCGSSSSSKSKSTAASTPATPSTPSTTTTTTTAGSAYGQQIQASLAPVTAEFRAVQANPQTAKQGSTWTKIAGTITTAKDKIGGLKPPSGASAIQSKLVSLLGAMATDAGAVGTDLNKGDKTAAQTDITKFRNDALQLQAFGRQLQAAH